MSDFAEFTAACRVRVNQTLAAMVPITPGSRLQEAMNYSLTNGGKRVRPLLVYASFQAVAGHTRHPGLDAVAAAVEAIHAYSLIHDDLPAMDDDALRRGQPTCHIAFGEALAILAGDALQSLAFELLSSAAAASADTRLQMIRHLSQAAGAKGMVAGQAIDLNAVATLPDLAALENMHRCKTGALIDASCALGAALAGADGDQLHQLTQYSRALGLAFQVQDDILDVITDTATLGKQQGADIARHKPTYVSLLGLDQAQSLAQQLCRDAEQALESFAIKAQPLQQLARYVVERTH
ncbi:MAG TPA: farnesyl diphosphate synthase [Cellvibrionaceae bacterium]